MRLFLFTLLQVLISIPLVSHAADSLKVPVSEETPKTGITEANKAAVAESYGKLPLYFIENKGQVNKAVKFYEKGAGHATFFTEDGVVIALTKSEAKEEKTLTRHNGALKEIKDKKYITEAVKLTFIGANKKAKITASAPLPGHVNYFVGNDKSKWRSNVPTYRAVTYEKVYDNIDIKFYGNNREIEHDIIVHPGGDPSAVKFVYEGIHGLKVTKNGDLEVSLTGGNIIEKRPIIYQEINGERKTIEGSYRILKGEDNAFSYGYEVASYDNTKKLVIDPVLVYSTYLGGSNDDDAIAIAVDASRSAYITGFTWSPDFPTLSPIQEGQGRVIIDAFITKLNSTGTAMVYSTYLGGGGYDYGYGIAVDALKNVYITGITTSVNFPILSPIQAIKGKTYDAFVTKIDSSGTAIVYSTFLGGNRIDSGNDIAVDAEGNAYITGEAQSTDFPVVNPIQGRLDNNFYAFVSKINPTGTALVYSTYLGGSSGAIGNGITVDSSGAAYVTGKTISLDFPVTAALQPNNAGGLDTFITKINPAGSAFVYSTYLGGSDSDDGRGIAVDSYGAVYVMGSTRSRDFPMMNPLQAIFGGGIDSFISKINPAGSAIVYSTYLGGSFDDNVNSIAVDKGGYAYVTGSTNSTDFPLVSPLQGTYGGGLGDAFISKINPAGSALVYSSYLGGMGSDSGIGVALDNSMNAYVTGGTYSLDFPTRSPIQANKAGQADSMDAFITKISTPAVIVTLSPDTISVAESSVIGYTVITANTTEDYQCINYWESLTLLDGSTYPAEGEFRGPLSQCLYGGATLTIHLTHGVPKWTPLGPYTLTAFIGAYGTPAHHIVVSEDHFSFEVTAFNPAMQNPQTSWRLLENGFK